MLAPDHAEPVADLPERRVGLDGLDHGRQQVLLSTGAFFEPGHGRCPGHRVSLRPNPAHALALAALAFGVDLLERRRGSFLVAELVDAHYHLGAALHRPLDAVGRFLYLTLLVTRLDRGQGSPQRLDLGEILVRSLLEAVGERLDVVTPRPRIASLRDARLA